MFTEDMMLELNGAKVVFFDLQNILILHPYETSIKMFAHLEESFGMEGFALARIQAEEEARNALSSVHDPQEVSLNQVYAYMHHSYECMLEQEASLQMVSNQINPEMLRLYQYALSQGLQVVIITDNLLSQIQIERILTDNGYRGYEMILFCAHLMDQTERLRLYEFAMNNFNVSVGDCVHIGTYDDKHSAGLKEIGVKFIASNLVGTQSNMLNSALFATLRKHSAKSPIPGIVQGLITINELQHMEKGYWYHFGYKYIGILAYAYVCFLREQFIKGKIDNIYFPLCEAGVFERIYKMLYGQVAEVRLCNLSLIELDSEEQAYEYIKQIGILSGKNAIAGLGWDNTLLNRIAHIATDKGTAVDLCGYFVGTHKFTAKKTKVIGFAMNQGLPKKASPCSTLLNEDLIVPLLEFTFFDTATYYGGGDISLEDQSIHSDMQAGILDFAKDFYELTKNAPLRISAEVAMVPMEQLLYNMSVYDEKMIAGLHLKKKNADGKCFIEVQAKRKFGIINPWPESISAESELMLRTRKAAQDAGLECVMLSNHGEILDSEQHETGKFVDGRYLDFVMTTHYETPKCVDAFYYHTLWNPPEIPLNTEYYAERVTDNYLMNDDFLIYDSGGMSNHLNSMLLNKPRDISGASTFIGSFPCSACLKPKLNNPKLFYCGMNWEKVLNNSDRHKGLFKLLDATGSVKFFGPEVVASWGGLRPWEGYKCYQYSIPFDGFSILNEINECGICLAISSDIHRRAGAATNRLYEACTAGAVIITDNNVFMETHFKDAALFINYNKNNPQDTFNQIMVHYNWVKNNPEQAMQLAYKAQQIFKDKFAMDKQLLDVVKSHPVRFNAINTDLFAKDDNQVVLVTYVVNSLDIQKACELLKSVISNVENQFYRRIILSVACDRTIVEHVTEYCNQRSSRISVYSMELFDHCGSRNMTDGQAIRLLQKSIQHQFFINTMANEVWFYDHVTTLIRAIEDENGAVCAYSGRLAMGESGKSYTDCFEQLKPSTIYHNSHPDYIPIPGQFIFKKSCDLFIPDFVFDCLDGLEHMAYLNILLFKHHKKIVFSRRMTTIYKYYDIDARGTVLSDEMQIRYIQGLVKYDIPTGVECSKGVIGETANTDINKWSIADMMMRIPVKKWLFLRYYTVRLRKVDASSDKGKRLLAKKMQLLQEYKEWAKF